MSFKDKVVIITGASSGIGRSTALQLAELGARLTITGRNEEKLESVADEVESISGKKPLAVIAELIEEAELKNIIESTLQRYSAIDVLINNAATLELGGIEYTTMEQFDNVFNINVRGTFQLTLLAVPHLIKTRGCIVNVSSINAIRSYPFSVAYNMSKAALDQMTKCLSVELAYRGVRVNSVNPGLIRTEFMKRGGLNNLAFTQALEYAKKNQPLGRLGEPDEVAKCIVLLADDESFFVNGVILPVDGGKVNCSS